MKRLFVLSFFLLWGAAAFGAPATVADLIQRFQLVSSQKTAMAAMEQILTFGVQRLGIDHGQADEAMKRLRVFDFDGRRTQLLTEKGDGRLSATELDYLANLGDATVLNRIWAADKTGEAPDFDEKLQAYKPGDLDDAKKRALDELAAFKTGLSKRYSPTLLKLIDSLLGPLVPEAQVPALNAFRSGVEQTLAGNQTGYAGYTFQHDQYLYRDLAAGDIEALNALHQDKTYLKLMALIDDATEALIDEMIDAAKPTAGT